MIYLGIPNSYLNRRDRYFFPLCILVPLLHVLQTLDNSDIGIQEPVYAVRQAFLLLAREIWGCDGRDASLEAAVGKLVDLHLDSLFGVLRVQKRRNFLFRGVAEGS